MNYRAAATGFMLLFVGFLGMEVIVLPLWGVKFVGPDFSAMQLLLKMAGIWRWFCVILFLVGLIRLLVASRGAPWGLQICWALYLYATSFIVWVFQNVLKETGGVYPSFVWKTLEVVQTAAHIWGLWFILSLVGVCARRLHCEPLAKLARVGQNLLLIQVVILVGIFGSAFVAGAGVISSGFLLIILCFGIVVIQLIFTGLLLMLLWKTASVMRSKARRCGK